MVFSSGISADTNVVVSLLKMRVRIENETLIRWYFFRHQIAWEYSQKWLDLELISQEII